MALRDITDPGAVAAALDEFDSLGREAFSRIMASARLNRISSTPGETNTIPRRS